MEKVKTEAELQQRILQLQTMQSEEAKLLKEEFHTTYNKIKPATIIQNIARKTVSSPGIKGFVINKTLDVALVLITNVILRKTTKSFIKRTLGTAAVWGIKHFVSNNPGIVKKAGTGILNGINNIISKRNRNKEYTYSSR